MNKHIGVSELKEISVLYQGDIYELACLILKVYDAKDKGTNTISRHTVNGLFKEYAMLARMESDQVLAVAEKHGLPLGATVEHDNDPRFINNRKI